MKMLYWFSSSNLHCEGDAQQKSNVQKFCWTLCFLKVKQVTEKKIKNK